MVQATNRVAMDMPPLRGWTIRNRPVLQTCRPYGAGVCLIGWFCKHVARVYRTVASNVRQAPEGRYA